MSTLLALLLIQELAPYAGPSERGVDVSTLERKLGVGYQGWFNTADDGAGRGWTHWAKDARKPFGPGNVKVDVWPDVSELAPEERFKTGFSKADGAPAEVFSSFVPATVLRHFRWMKEYGIDAAFVQRFAADLGDPRVLKHNNVVLASCREGANRSGRGWCVMYDLTGLKAGRMENLKADWRSLREKMKIGEDPAYQKHRGRPLVAVWGVGFSDGRAYTLAECADLVAFFKADGCSVMLGVPSFWRDLHRDAAPDPALHDLLKQADVLSPWSVGRYGTPEQAASHGAKVWAADAAWCREAKLDWLPVAFPGFSWHHMTGKALDQIPRRKGAFFWSQLVAAKRSGASMIYVAMFDEVDEGTAIFKCADQAGFVGMEGLPSDFYLKLAGAGGKLLRGEIPANDEVPK